MRSATRAPAVSAPPFTPEYTKLPQRIRLLGLPGGVIVGLLASKAAGRAWRRRRREALADEPGAARRLSAADACVLLALAAAAAGRALNVRALVAPAWVDSVHHTVITQLIADAGAIPTSYEPFMPVQDFHYHLGFHALAAVLMRLSGLPAHRAVLLLGQALNGAGVLAAYLLDGQPLPPRPVMISVDDGNRSFYENGWPIMQETSLRPVMFLVPCFAEYSGYVNWDEMRALVAGGAWIGSPGYSHRHLREVPKSEHG